tara:strand:+ start:324 stop:2585 length:2262 start_codon:yes stop_codon:yes gene_type:complete
MSVLNRKLFNRGGKVSSRGVGITSGLAAPVRGYKIGGGVVNPEVLEANRNTSIPEAGLADKVQSNIDMLRSTGLFPERQPFDTKAALIPYIMDVSSRLLSGTSPTGDLGEIAGQALQGGNPLLAQALQEKRAFEAQDPDAELNKLALELALKDDPTANITGEKITTVVRDGKPIQLLSYFKDGIYTEKVIGDAVPTAESAVKGIPRDIFDTLPKEDKDAVLGLIDNPEITSANIIEVVKDGKPVKKLTYFNDGVYTEKIIGAVAEEPVNIKGVPQEIYDGLNDDQKERLLGIDVAPETIKGIPREFFDGLSEKNQNIILGLGGTGITDVNISDILGADGKTPEKVLTYFEDGVFKQIDLGKAVPAKDGSTEAERAIDALKDLTGQNKSDYQDIINQYGPLPSGDTSETFTDADTDLIFQKAKNNLAKIKTTETKEILSAEDLSNLALNEEIVKEVIIPKVQKIEKEADIGVANKAIANGVQTAVQGFQPGAFVTPRMSIARFVDLLNPENLTEGQIQALAKFRVGDPVSADILSILSSQLTLSKAEGGALPGNLNQKEFQELKNAGLPLFTTKEGMLVVSDLLTREADIRIKAKEMQGDLIGQQKRGEETFTITMPNGEARTFNNFYSALDEIEDFVIKELPKVYSGSEMMGTDDLTNRINGLGRYDKDSLDLSGGNIINPINGKKINAKTAEETGQLTFSHWGDADNPNPLHRNKAVYLFNTGEVWTGNEPQFNKEIHQIGKPITAYWVKAN